MEQKKKTCEKLINGKLVEGEKKNEKNEEKNRI